MQTVYVHVTVALTIELADDEQIDNVLNEMDYNFMAAEMHASSVSNMEIIDFQKVGDGDEL